MRIDALLGQRVYLDSNALICAVEGDPATHPASVAALIGAVSGNEIAAYASLLVRAEVLVLPLKTGNQPQIAFYRRLLDESGPLRIAALTPLVADAAATLRPRQASAGLHRLGHAPFPNTKRLRHESTQRC